MVTICHTGSAWSIVQSVLLLSASYAANAMKAMREMMRLKAFYYKPTLI